MGFHTSQKAGVIFRYAFIFFLLSGFANLFAAGGQPIANNDSIEVFEGSHVDFTVSGVDKDGQSDPEMTYHIVSWPVKGQLKGPWPNNKRYVPNAGATGTDQFSFKVRDASGVYSRPATVTINILKADRLPIAKDITIEVAEGSHVDFKVSGVNKDGQADPEMTYHIVSWPIKGQLKGPWPNNKRYTPNSGATGTDHFSFRVKDTNGVYSKPATVTINILKPDNLPVANPDTVEVLKDGYIDFKVSGVNKDGQADSSLSYHIVSWPGKGTLRGPWPNYKRYTPNKGVTGNDQFSFKVKDSRGVYSKPATVNIEIKEVASKNTPPVAKASSQATKKDTSVTISLQGTDADGDELSYFIVKQPTIGKLLKPIGNQVTYTPNSGVTGNDSFTFRVFDGQSYSAEATVSIAVTASAINQPPVASASSEITGVNTPVEIFLKASDPEGGKLNYSIVRQPSKGKLTIPSDNKVTYTPNSGISGSDSFTFSVSDGALSSNIAEVKISINGKVEINLTLARRLSRTTSAGTMNDVVTTSTHAFVANGESGVHVVSNINSLTISPSIVKTVDTTGFAQSLEVSSNQQTLFVADGYGGLKVMDISKPAKARVIGSVATLYSAEEIVLSGDNKYAYIADGSGLVVVDVANLTKPKIIGHVQLSVGYAEGIAISGDNKRIYMASGDAGLLIFDISRPELPSYLGRIDTKGYANEVVLSKNGNTAFVADSYNGLVVIDIRKPSAPGILSIWNTTPPSYILEKLNVSDVHLLSDGVTLIIAAGSPGMYSLDVSNPAKPVETGWKETQSFVTRLSFTRDESKAVIIDFYYDLIIYDIRKYQ